MQGILRRRWLSWSSDLWLSEWLVGEEGLGVENRKRLEDRGGQVALKEGG
jgi:hypothetical protein